MKRILGTLVGLLLMCGVAFAEGGQDTWGWSLVIDSETVNATDVIYSNALVVGPFDSYSYILSGHSGDSPDVKLEVQIIDTNTSNFEVIGTTNDASVDPSFELGVSSKNYTGVWTDLGGFSTGTLFASYTSCTTPTSDSFELPPTRYFRFRVTGNGGNSTDTKISVTLGRYGER